MSFGISDLLSAIHSAQHSYNVDLIVKAYEFAKNCHSHQKRLSGDPYIAHPISVALILIDLGMDNSAQGIWRRYFAFG